MGGKLGKRGPKKGHGKGGRPLGGKSHPALRRYWREQKRKQAAKKRREEATRKRMRRKR
jgi:hypothetical protein